MAAAKQGRTLTEIIAEYQAAPDEFSDHYEEGEKDTNYEEHTVQDDQHEAFRDPEVASEDEDAERGFEPVDATDGDTESKDQTRVNILAPEDNNAAAHESYEVPDHVDPDGPSDQTQDANEESATSTIRGDDGPAEGEFYPRLEICIAPDACICRDCKANLKTDEQNARDTTGSANIDSLDSTEPASSRQAHTANDFQKETTNSFEAAGGESSDTETSRTIEGDQEGRGAAQTLGRDVEEHDFQYDQTGARTPSIEDEGDLLNLNEEEVNGNPADHPLGEVQSPADHDEEDLFLDQKVHVDVVAEGGQLDFEDETEDTNGHVTRYEGALVQQTTPPATPSGPKLAKRKSRSDDDEIEIDVNTPEPKRRRPSLK